MKQQTKDKIKATITMTLSELGTIGIGALTLDWSNPLSTANVSKVLGVLIVAAYIAWGVWHNQNFTAKASDAQKILDTAKTLGIPVADVLSQTVAPAQQTTQVVEQQPTTTIPLESDPGETNRPKIQEVQNA